MKTINLQAGTVTTNEFSNFAIHTYTSPESGGLVNSQIIETSNHLVLVDTQYLLPFATELKEYLLGIKKPIERIIISHSHPDHWFGNEFFKDQKIFALQEVRSILEQAGDAMIESYQFMNENGPLVPTAKTLPNFTLNEGLFTLDSVEFSVVKFTDAEDSIIAGIEIPKENILIAQDIVYDFTHAFTAELANVQNKWIEILENIKSKNYSLILGGHGIPSEGDILATAISYLHDATTAIRKALNEGTDKESKTQIYSQAMLEKYPELKSQVLVQLCANYMFN
jgi:glyoxylase-like metal-dependent hydrolase (beta-lactamase superfamily II)